LQLSRFASKLGVIVLSILLITGISLVPTLQIGVEGRGGGGKLPPPPGIVVPPSQIPRPPSPGGSPSSGTPPLPTASPTPPSPGGSPSSGTPPLPTASPALDTTDDRAVNQTGAAANQTEGDGAVNQSAMIMIPQNSMEMIMSHVQDAMTAIDVHNKDNATKALKSLIRELKSAANARGISIEITTG